MDVTTQWMSPSNGCHRAMDVTAKGCQSKGMPEQRDIKAKGCQSKGMSKQREVKAKGGQSKGCRSKGMSKQRDVQADRLNFHNLNFQTLKEVSHESFIFTFAAFTFWGKSRTKVSFSHLPISLFEGRLARKLRLRIFNFQILREVSHDMHFWKLADAPNAVFCGTKRVPARKMDGEACPRSGTANLGFICTTWSFKIWRTSRTKASFLHVRFSDFEGNLARKLRFRIFHFQILKERLARKLRFRIFHFQILKECLARKLRFHIFHFPGKPSTHCFGHLTFQSVQKIGHWKAYHFRSRNINGYLWHFCNPFAAKDEVHFYGFFVCENHKNGLLGESSLKQ